MVAPGGTLGDRKSTANQQWTSGVVIYCGKQGHYRPSYRCDCKKLTKVSRDGDKKKPKQKVNMATVGEACLAASDVGRSGC